MSSTLKILRQCLHWAEMREYAVRYEKHFQIEKELLEVKAEFMCIGEKRNLRGQISKRTMMKLPHIKSEWFTLNFKKAVGQLIMWSNPRIAKNLNKVQIFEVFERLYLVSSKI